jgi:hypothetical protein
MSPSGVESSIPHRPRVGKRQKRFFTFALDANREKVNTIHFYLPPSGVRLPVKNPVARPDNQA